MKTLRLFSVLVGLATIFFAGMSFTSSSDNLLSSFDYFASDFRISNVTASGGLCEGSQNKVRVTVTNSGNSAYKQDVPVRLAVSQKGSKTKYYLGKVKGGFSGRDNYGKAVWFHNITLKNQEKVTLTAEVNHDKSVSESAYGNNRRSSTVKPKGKCGQPSVAATAGKTLTVGVYQGSVSNPMPELRIYARRTGDQKFGITANNGVTSLANVGKGLWEIEVRQGTAVWETRSYNMPAYNARLNIIL